MTNCQFMQPTHRETVKFVDSKCSLGRQGKYCRDATDQCQEAIRVDLRYFFPWKMYSLLTAGNQSSIVQQKLHVLVPWQNPLIQLAVVHVFIVEQERFGVYYRAWSGCHLTFHLRLLLVLLLYFDQRKINESPVEDKVFSNCCWSYAQQVNSQVDPL
jgi:hypothetical protein